MNENEIKLTKLLEADFGLDYILGTEETVGVADKKYFVLIIYDISDNKRRNNMVKILSSYGFRVQKSAFEAMLKDNKYKKLLGEIEKIPDKSDSVRVYKIQCQGSVKVFGEPFSIVDEDTVII